MWLGNLSNLSAVAVGKCCRIVNGWGWWTILGPSGLCTWKAILWDPRSSHRMADIKGPSLLLAGEVTGLACVLGYWFSALCYEVLTRTGSSRAHIAHAWASQTLSQIKPLFFTNSLSKYSTKVMESVTDMSTAFLWSVSIVVLKQTQKCIQRKGQPPKRTTPCFLTHSFGIYPLFDILTLPLLELFLFSADWILFETWSLGYLSLLSPCVPHIYKCLVLGMIGHRHPRTLKDNSMRLPEFKLTWTPRLQGFFEGLWEVAEDALRLWGPVFRAQPRGAFRFNKHSPTILTHHFFPAVSSPIILVQVDYICPCYHGIFWDGGMEIYMCSIVIFIWQV